MRVEYVGTAGWNVPATQSHLSPHSSSHLERYARLLNGAEINSSFYRPHKLETWKRWQATVPEGFRFSVKAPKAITHDRALLDCEGLLAEFFEQLTGLGPRLGPVLFQLPPKLVWDEQKVSGFLRSLRGLHRGQVVIEPRHASWFTPAAESILEEFRVARVSADPALASPSAPETGGYKELRYYRWHGSPQIYRSAYDLSKLAILAAEVSQARDGDTWIIFDNTASGAAFPNALEMQGLLGARSQ